MRTTITSLIFALLSLSALAGDGTISNPDLADNASVALSKLELIQNNSVVGNASGGVANPQQLNSQQLTSILDAFTGDSGSGGVKGAVPAPSAGDAGQGDFLHAGGTWSVPQIPISPNQTAGAVISTNGSSWAASVVAVPACQAISGTEIDWSLGNCFTKTLSANTTFTMKNRVAGQTIIVRTTNPASYTVTWPNTHSQGNSVLWSSSTVPTASTTNKRDIWTIFYDGTEMYGTQNSSF